MFILCFLFSIAALCLAISKREITVHQHPMTQINIGVAEEKLYIIHCTKIQVVSCIVFVLNYDVYTKVS